MNNLKKSKIIRFKKEEIHEIMELYSKKISIGEWKDYSITFQKVTLFLQFIDHLSTVLA